MGGIDSRERKNLEKTHRKTKIYNNQLNSEEYNGDVDGMGRDRMIKSLNEDQDNYDKYDD